MPPEITVITATRNAMAHLPRLAQAVLNPANDFVEWIVIDAQSGDGTAAFLQGLRDPRLSWVSEPDEGIYDAWNKGVARARGRWLLFLGADDQVEADWLRACAAQADADLIYGDVIIRSAEGATLGRMTARPWTDVMAALPRRLLLAHPGLAHHRRLFASRRFDPAYRIAGDFAFLAGAGLRTARPLPLVQAVIQLGGLSNSAGQVDKAYRENLRVLQSQGARMPLGDRLVWAAKRAAARVSVNGFAALQTLAWRHRRHP